MSRRSRARPVLTQRWIRCASLSLPQTLATRGQKLSKYFFTKRLTASPTLCRVPSSANAASVINRFRATSGTLSFSIQRVKSFVRLLLATRLRQVHLHLGQLPPARRPLLRPLPDMFPTRYARVSTGGAGKTISASSHSTGNPILTAASTSRMPWLTWFLPCNPASDVESTGRGRRRSSHESKRAGNRLGPDVSGSFSDR